MFLVGYSTLVTLFVGSSDYNKVKKSNATEKVDRPIVWERA